MAVLKLLNKGFNKVRTFFGTWFLLDWESLVDNEHQPMLDCHVPAPQSFSHAWFEVAAPLINVVNSLKVDLTISLDLGQLLWL